MLHSDAEQEQKLERCQQQRDLSSCTSHITIKLLYWFVSAPIA